MDIIKSVSESQNEIFNNIIRLYCPDGFEVDPTYSKGNFYKVVPEPKYKLDLYPQSEEVKEADSRHLPFNNSSVESIVFDPPFIGASRKNGKPGIINLLFNLAWWYNPLKRWGGYNRYGILGFQSIRFWDIPQFFRVFLGCYWGNPHYYYLWLNIRQSQNPSQVFPCLLRRGGV